jgi:hypothetical protein
VPSVAVTRYILVFVDRHQLLMLDAARQTKQKEQRRRPSDGHTNIEMSQAQEMNQWRGPKDTLDNNNNDNNNNKSQPTHNRRTHTHTHNDTHIHTYTLSHTLTHSHKEGVETYQGERLFDEECALGVITVSVALLSA